NRNAKRRIRLSLALDLRVSIKQDKRRFYMSTLLKKVSLQSLGQMKFGRFITIYMVYFEAEVIHGRQKLLVQMAHEEKT
ncbi:hypothetical protein, partial [Aliikangiella maris]